MRTRMLHEKMEENTIEAAMLSGDLVEMDKTDRMRDNATKLSKCS